MRTTVVTALSQDKREKFKALCDHNASTISQTMRSLIDKFISENQKSN